jgi:hypothetical protein
MSWATPRYIGYAAIAWFLRYLAHHSVRLFVVYRILLGGGDLSQVVGYGPRPDECAETRAPFPPTEAPSSVIVPVQAEYYALEGVAQILGSIETIRARRLARARALLALGARLDLARGRVRDRRGLYSRRNGSDDRHGGGGAGARMAARAPSARRRQCRGAQPQ